MVLSGQARSSFLSDPLLLKSSPKIVEFPLSHFNVKNGVSSGHVTNPLFPVKVKKIPSTRTSIIQKNYFDREALARSVDSVNASESSREENSSWNRKIFISRRKKRWFTWSLLEEIVNFVFNKSTQETRRTQLSRLFYKRRRRQEKQNKPKP